MQAKVNQLVTITFSELINRLDLITQAQLQMPQCYHSYFEQILRHAVLFHISHLGKLTKSN